jgi:serine acetyltransferase
MMISFLRALHSLVHRLASALRLLPLRILGFSPGRNMRVGRGIGWPLMNLRQIAIGDDVKLGAKGWVFIPIANRSAKISIGRGTAIGNDFTISCNNNIRIGNDCCIGYRVSILDFDHITGQGIHPVNSGFTKGEPITIGDDCFIGCGVVILRGVTLGKNCVVNANSVVMRSFEDNCVLTGSPAKVVMMVEPVAK